MVDYQAKIAKLQEEALMPRKTPKRLQKINELISKYSLLAMKPAKQPKGSRRTTKSLEQKIEELQAKIAIRDTKEKNRVFKPSFVGALLPTQQRGTKNQQLVAVKKETAKIAREAAKAKRDVERELTRQAMKATKKERAAANRTAKKLAYQGQEGLALAEMMGNYRKSRYS